MRKKLFPRTLAITESSLLGLTRTYADRDIKHYLLWRAKFHPPYPWSCYVSPVANRQNEAKDTVSVLLIPLSYVFNCPISLLG